MIEGVTKPFETGRELAPDEMRAAATVYIAGMKGLFDRFDPLTGGDPNLSLDVPFNGQADAMGAVAERGTSSLEVFAPDSQWHSYRLQGDQAVWRDDGLITDSLDRPDAERMLLPENASAAERLDHLQRLAADAEALSAYEPTSGPVGEEEVSKLFELLMLGRPAPGIEGADDL